MMEQLARAWLEYVWLGLWQGTLLVGALAFWARAVRIGAAARHGAFLLLLLAMAVLPIVLRSPREQDYRDAPSAVATHEPARTPSAAPVSFNFQQPAAANVGEDADLPGDALIAPVRTITISRSSWLTVLFVCWLGVVALQLVRIAGALLVVRRIRRDARRPTEPLYARCTALAGDSLERGLLRVSTRVRAPLTLGVLRQHIVLPAGMAEQLSDPELRDVLLHELAHVQRRDGLSCLLQRLAEALLIHHPAAWWLSRRLHVEREWACDERVVRRTGAASAYARSLLRVAALTRSAPQLLMASSAPGAGLSTRVERLLKPAAAQSWRNRAIIASAAVAMLCIAAASPRPHFKAPIAVATLSDAASAQPALTDDEIARRIDGTITSYVQHGFSGVVLVARGDRILLNKGYGLADRERGVPMSANTYFSTAGITKAVTAAGVLLLEQDGVLSTNDRLAKFIGDLPGAKNATTLHDLLLHTDGLSRPGAKLSNTSQASFVASIKETPIAYEPGSATRYTDVGYSLLGIVLERATGESYESFIRRRVLEPAGMKDSRFENEPLPAGATLAREYSGPVGAQQPVGTRAYTWGRRASLGLVSTALDVYRLLRASEEGFPEAVRRKLFQPQTSSEGSLHAYGWDVLERRESVLHRRLAGTPGFEGEVLHDVTGDWSAVILVNSAVGWRFAVWDEIAKAFRALPPTDIDFVLSQRRYSPYRGGSVQPVLTLAQKN